MEINNKLISIIVPAFNAEKTLERCLLSLLHQSYKKLQIIIINDGSTDQSNEICKKFEEQDKRIVYVCQDNKGVSESRNVGLKYAEGEYIVFVDSDDYIDESFCEIMLDALIKTDSDICICKNKDIVVDSVDHFFNSKKNKTSYRLKCIESENYDFYRNDSHWTVWGVIFKKTVVQNLEFDKNLSVAEDSLFLAQSLINAEKISFIDAELYFYVIYQKSLSHGTFTEKKYTELYSWREITNLFKNCKQFNNVQATYAIRCLKLIKLYKKNSLFKKEYFDATISEYRRNVKYVLAEDKNNKDYAKLLYHLMFYICPSVACLIKH